MSDETCCGACGYPVYATKESACDWCRQSADRIEALTKEREKLGREVNMARYGQPDFAWSIHKEAMADLEARLRKAAAFLEEIAVTGDWFISDMNDLIKELKGESHE